ncbi:unnamed protein product [Penicillium camemberti]|uniref:Str. FM013 n=1 Tax=Penicillium camemberti (strain FM 013) TaxID=1429867 RepID=A0A0G4PKH8_PENC3|nr:unnamed protein product [Penicillium camemberti]
MEALERFAFLILYIFFPVSRYVLRTPYIRIHLPTPQCAGPSPAIPPSRIRTRFGMLDM